MTAQVSLKELLYSPTQSSCHCLTYFFSIQKISEANQAKANLKFIYVVKPEKLSPFWKEMLALT